MKQRIYAVVVGLISFLIFVSSAGRAVGFEMLEIKEIMILTAVQLYFIFLIGANKKSDTSHTGKR